MSNEKTTVSVGFKTDVQGLNQADRLLNQIERRLNTLGGSMRRLREQSNLGSGGHRISSGTFNFPFSGGIKGAGRMGLAGGLAGFGAFGLTMGAIGLITKAVGGAKEYLNVLDPLSKQLMVVGYGQDCFAQSLERTGAAIGKNRTEMMRLAQTYISQAGGQGDRVARQVGVIGLMSRGMGLDAGMMASTMGGFAQMGATGQYGGMRMERFAAVLADAVSRGGMKGREAEMFGSIQSLMGAQLNVLTRLAPGSSTAMIGALTAMNASGRPGLMGMRGANVLSQMNSVFMNPQGDFGEYFMYNALGGGDYFDYQMRKEQGIFGKGNLQSVMGSFRKNMPNDKARWYAMSKMFGISMSQAQAIDGLDMSANTGFLSALDKATGGSMEGVGADKLGLMAEIFNASGSRREALFKDSRIADLASKKGWNAKTSMNEILSGIAGTNMVQTEQERMLSELATIDNTINKVGEQIIPLLTDVAAGINHIVDYFKSSIETSDQQKAAVKAQQEAAAQAAEASGGTNTIGRGATVGSNGRFGGAGELPWGQTVKLRVEVEKDRVPAGDGNTAKLFVAH